MNVILPCRFYLRDLSSQLREEQNKFPDKNRGHIINLYRGQRMKMKELEILRKTTVGSLISVDSFFSTSRSDVIAAGFMGIDTKAKDDNEVPLRYEIKCDLRLQTKPYADISSPKLGPSPHEKEVLFMVGTIFKFKGIFYDKKLKYWRVKLQLFDENSPRLSKLYNSIRDEMGEETSLLTLGGLLLRAGEYEHALRIYMRSFFDLMLSDGDLSEYGTHNLTKSFMGIAIVHSELGRYDDSIQLFDVTIKFINEHKNARERHYQQATAYYSKSSPLSEKGKYSDALKQCKHALQIFNKYPGHYDSHVANCYEMMGNIYGNKGRLEKMKHNISDHYQYFQIAHDYYNKALEIRQKNS